MVVLLLIAASWFGLGICFGIGYCPCTDWHWEIRRSMGKTDLPVSYIKFLLDSLLGTDLARELVDQTTAFIFFAVFFISAILFNHELKAKR
jgi:hypothetical protein